MSTAMMRRLERIAAARQPPGLLIVPPEMPGDRPPTEEERADLVRKLEACRDNDRLIVVIHQGPRLDAWHLPEGLISGGVVLRWQGLTSGVAPL